MAISLCEVKLDHFVPNSFIIAEGIANFVFVKFIYFQIKQANMGYKCPRSLFGLSVTVTGLFVLFSFTLQESLSDNNDSEFVHKDVDMVVRSIRTKYYDDYHDSHSSNKIIINHAENVTVQGEKSMVNRGESQNLKPHPIFPAKNSTQLKATLKEINNILQPIYKEITKKVTEFKGIRIREVKNLTTVQNVINGFEEHYFRWEKLHIYDLRSSNLAGANLIIWKVFANSKRSKRKFGFGRVLLAFSCADFSLTSRNISLKSDDKRSTT